MVLSSYITCAYALGYHNNNNIQIAAKKESMIPLLAYFKLSKCFGITRLGAAHIVTTTKFQSILALEDYITPHLNISLGESLCFDYNNQNGTRICIRKPDDRSKDRPGEQRKRRQEG